MKKGLVIIYDPHALMQFLQFYCMGDFVAEWDALCLPKENGKEEMHIYCEKAGVFHQIYKNDTSFQSLPLYKKFWLFLTMTLYALFGKRKAFCKKTINKYVENVDKYDYYVANCENGFVSGMIASLGEDKVSIFFEDGAGDYVTPRSRYHSCYRKWSFEDIQCILVSRMGYFGKGFTYLEPTKYCYKYASVPEELAYTNYREIRRFWLNEEALSRFREIIKTIYPETELFKKILSDDVFVFTTPRDSNEEKINREYQIKFIDYINNNAKKIFLKKHPRDNLQYNFPNSVCVCEIPQDIPAEIIFPFFKGNICYMMEPDSLLLNMAIYPAFIIFLYYSAYEIEMKKHFPSWYGKERYDEFCKRFIKGKYKFIEI